MRYLWEASNGKFCVMCEMQKMDPWKMHESKEGGPEVGERFCESKMQEASCWIYEGVEESSEEVETVRGSCYLGDGVNAGGGLRQL